MNKQGEFLKSLRRKQGLTQKQLAEKLNVSDKVISKWEVGDSFPDYSLLMPLSEILKVDVQEILNGEYNSPELQKAETKSVIYVERKNDKENLTFKDYIIKGFKFLFKYKQVLFAGLFIVCILAMFCNFLSWPYGNIGFKNNFFKFLFAPFKGDINSYLYSDYLLMFSDSFKKNTNIFVYIISALVWLYILYLLFTVVKLIILVIKKQKFETQKLFISSIVVLVFSVVFIIMSHILKSKLIEMLESSGFFDYSLYENQGAVIKTMNLFPFIWSLVPVIFASIFKFWKIFEDIKINVQDNENAICFGKNTILKVNKKNSEENSIKKNDKAKKVIKISVSLVLAIILYIGGIFSANLIYKNNQETNLQNKLRNAYEQFIVDSLESYEYFLQKDIYFKSKKIHIIILTP